MVTSFREEFRLKNVCLHHFKEELFYLPQFRWPPFLFVLYRISIALYVDINLILDASRLTNLPFQWPVYLTNWSYFMLGCHLTLAATIAVIHNLVQEHRCCRRHQEHEEELLQGSPEHWGEDDFYSMNPPSIPWYMKLNWIIFNIIGNVAFLVSLVYFIFLYPAQHPKGGILFVDFNLHAINSVIIIIEMFINALPIRLLHMIYPFVFGFTYVIFSIIYWAYDHSAVIYPGVLDWNNPGRTIGFLLGAGFVLVPLLHLFLYGLYRLRLFLFTKCYQQR